MSVSMLARHSRKSPVTAGTAQLTDGQVMKSEGVGGWIDANAHAARP